MEDVTPQNKKIFLIALALFCILTVILSNVQASHILGFYNATFFGNVNISGNLRFHGELKPEGATCSDGDVLVRLGDGKWGCINNESIGGGGGGGSSQFWDDDITGWISSNASINSGNINVSGDLLVTDAAALGDAAMPSTGELNVSENIYMQTQKYIYFGTKNDGKRMYYNTTTNELVIEDWD